MMDDFYDFIIYILTEYQVGIAKSIVIVWVTIFIVASIRAWRKGGKLYKEAPDQFRLW